MTSHATKPQMQRMLRYSNALARIIAAVKYFKRSSCERMADEKKRAVAKAPGPYTFGEEVGIDVLEIKGARCQVPGCSSGTAFQSGEVLGPYMGVPKSKEQCLAVFGRFWLA